MTYVPDETVLGNPGIFGFIRKAVGTVAKVVGGAIGISQAKITIPAPQVTIVPTAAAAQAAATGAIQGLPRWAIPVGIGALGLVLLLSMRRR